MMNKRSRSSWWRLTAFRTSHFVAKKNNGQGATTRKTITSNLNLLRIDIQQRWQKATHLFNDIITKPFFGLTINFKAWSPTNIMQNNRGVIQWTQFKIAPRNAAWSNAGRWIANHSTSRSPSNDPLSSRNFVHPGQLDKSPI